MGYMKKFYFIVIMLLGVMIMPTFVKADELTSVDLTGVNKPTAPGQVTFSGALTTESDEKFTIVGQAWGELISGESDNTFEYVGSGNDLIPGAVTLSHGGKTYTPDQITNDSDTYSLDKHVLYYVVVLSKKAEADTYGENIAITINGGEAQTDVKKVVNGGNVYLYVMSYSATVQGDEYVFADKGDGVFNISYTEGTDLTASVSECEHLQDTEICKFLSAYGVGSALTAVDDVYLIKKDDAYSISTSATPGTGETQYLKITKKSGSYVITPLVKEDFTATKSAYSFLVKVESITGSSTAKKYYVDEYSSVSFKFKYTEASSEEGGKGDAEEEGGKGEITPDVVNVSTTKDSDVSNNVKDAIAKAIETGKGTTGISDELAAAIKDASEAGCEITTGLVAEAKTEASLSKDTLDKFGTKLTKNTNVLGYYDVNLYVYADGTPLGKITDLTKSLKVTLNTKDLINKLPAVKSGKVRRYYAIQIHNGKVTKKAAALNSDKSISFDANGFSDYAIVYEDVDKTTTNPNTNDDITMYASMLTLSSLGLSIILFNKKRLN